MSLAYNADAHRATLIPGGVQATNHHHAFPPEAASMKNVNVQDERRETATVCSHCHQVGKVVLVCSKCKITVYCSKECQKNQWAFHKDYCKATTSGVGHNLIRSFMADSFLHGRIQMAFVLLFGLHRKMVTEEPLLMCFEMDTDCANMETVRSVIAGSQTPADFPRGIQGMLQIKSYTKVDIKANPIGTRLTLWENCKESEGEDGNPFKNAVGIVDFRMKGTNQAITFALPIDDAAVLEARDIQGTTRDIPEVMTAINVYIYGDTTNQLRLRTRLPREDLYKYKGMRDSEVQKLPAMFSSQDSDFQ